MSDILQQDIEAFLKAGGKIKVFPASWEKPKDPQSEDVDLDGFAAKIGIVRKTLTDAIKKGEYQGVKLPKHETRTAKREVFQSKTRPQKNKYFKRAEVEEFLKEWRSKNGRKV